jgi:YHS domain-containing protein
LKFLEPDAINNIDNQSERMKMSEEQEKIECHVCKKEIPKAAALNAEGGGYVHYFCNTSCLTFWEEKEQDNKDEKEEK